MNEKYDIVGDIHGYADKLQRLLRRLGYEERDGIYAMRPGNLSSSATSLTGDQRFGARCRSCAR